MEEYLFGEQPDVPRPFTKPLTQSKSETAPKAETPKPEPKTRSEEILDELRQMEKEDINIGREWDSPFGRLKITGITMGGGESYLTNPLYEVKNLSTDGNLRYRKETMESEIAWHTEQLTPEYKAAEEERKQRDQRQQDREAAEKAALDEQLAQIAEFTTGKTPMAAGRMRDALQQKFRYDGVVMTRKNKIEQLIAAGENPKVREEDAVQELSGNRMNRMDDREQAAFEKRRREAGKKNNYYVGGYNVGKIGYDYAVWLQSKIEPASPPPTETPTKQPEGQQGVGEAVVPDLPKFYAEEVAAKEAWEIRYQLVKEAYGEGTAKMQLGEAVKPSTMDAYEKVVQIAKEQGYSWDSVLQKVKDQLGLNDDYTQSGSNTDVVNTAARAVIEKTKADNAKLETERDAQTEEKAKEQALKKAEADKKASADEQQRADEAAKKKAENEAFFDSEVAKLADAVVEAPARLVGAAAFRGRHRDVRP